MGVACLVVGGGGRVVGWWWFLAVGVWVEEELPMIIGGPVGFPIRSLLAWR